MGNADRHYPADHGMWRRWWQRRRKFDTHADASAYTDANPHTDADTLSNADADAHAHANPRVDANAGDPPPASCEPHTSGSE